MASVVVNGAHMVLISLNKIAVYKLGSDKQKLNLSLPSWSKESKSGDGKDDGTDSILAASFSSSGKYFSVCDDHKRLAIWSVEDSWKLLNTRPIPRRATTMLICEKEQTIIVADKSGDVHRFSIVMKEEEAAGKIVSTHSGGGKEINGSDPSEETLVMGHVSMLLDLKLVGDGKLLVTCDRDEKIRVSHYPNSYNIQSFCLGHTDFVSRLAYLEDKDLLVSGSGDGTIKLWDYRNGRLLYDVDCAAILNRPGSASFDPSSSSYEPVILCKCNVGDVGGNRCRGADIKCLIYSGTNNVIAVSFERRSTVLLFRLTHDGTLYTISYLQRLQTSSPVWDIAFVSDQDLVVLQSDETAAVVPYRIQDVAYAYQVTPLTTSAACSADLLHTIALINKDKNLFADCRGIKSEGSKLHKVHIDNMKEYIERKKGRMQPSKPSATAAGGDVTADSKEGESCESIAKKIKFTELLLT